MAARFNKKRNTQTFDVGDIVSVKIPPKDRATSIDNRRIYTRVLERKRDIYQLQTKYGVLIRWYYTRDLAPVAPTLAKSLNLPKNTRVIILRQATHSSTTAASVRISYRYKGLCDSNRCGCKKNRVKYSIHYYKGIRDCGRLNEGPKFGNYALINSGGSHKGKEREH